MSVFGAEFVAMLLVIVYVGAVAVLFLFVVMMLDVDFAELKAEMARYMPLALLIGLVILMQFVMAYGAWETAHAAPELLQNPAPADKHNTEALGLIIYDQYFLLFQLAGLILLVAMIGAIVLTLPGGHQAPEPCRPDDARPGRRYGTQGRETGAGAVIQ